MNATLKNDKGALLDKDAVFKDPKAEGREWLRDWLEKREQREEEEQREAD